MTVFTRHRTLLDLNLNTGPVPNAASKLLVNTCIGDAIVCYQLLRFSCLLSLNWHLLPNFNTNFDKTISNKHDLTPTFRLDTSFQLFPHRQKICCVCVTLCLPDIKYIYSITVFGVEIPFYDKMSNGFLTTAVHLTSFL